VSEYKVVREKASAEHRDIERALTRFIAKTGDTENLFPDDPYAFPCKYHFCLLLTNSSDLYFCDLLLNSDIVSWYWYFQFLHIQLIFPELIFLILQAGCHSCGLTINKKWWWKAC